MLYSLVWVQSEVSFAGATAKSMLHIDMPEKASNTKIFASGIIGAMVLGSAGFFAGKIGKACIPPAIDMVRSSINTFLQKKP